MIMQKGVNCFVVNLRVDDITVRRWGLGGSIHVVCRVKSDE